MSKFREFVVGALAFWYVKCPAPRLYRYVTGKFI